MTSSKPSIGAGDVVIKLADEERVLRPTLRAAIAISRMSGGILGAMERVGRLDLDAMVAVTAAGLDLTEHGMKGLDEKVYASGLGYADGLAKPLTAYLEILANGGKPRPTVGARDDTADPQQSSE